MTTSADNSLRTSWPRREKNGSITGTWTGNNRLMCLNTIILRYKNHQPISSHYKTRLHLAVLKTKAIPFI